MLDIINIVANVEIWLAFSLATTATIIYAGLFNWRLTIGGRAVLFLFLSGVTVASMSILTVWLGEDFWLRPMWRIFSWSLVVAALLNFMRVLYIRFRQNPDSTDDELPDPKD